ncbi:FecR family protein [Peteryoungia ipomoeae]|uniref:FecR family protein n=1 Tax=Peteryoungia ipomoeae TaxID=1210932 RepID=A0A4S8NS84_9HYPH|nr:FecR family protein [Peteryoungia ipomoeae]THV20223.1 FecR family protein [Peteryoungia ipomoeae]
MRELLLEEAMDWLMRMNETPQDAEVDRQWQAWMQRSDMHVAAWTRICRTWAALGEQPPLIKARLVQPEGNARRTPRRRPYVATATLLIAGLAAVIFGPALRMRLEADFRTSAGETEVVTLADGSRVTLAPETAIAEGFDPALRRIKLLSGEAYFEVTRDPQRPFTVEASNASVRVLGTAFGVRETQEGTRVELASGSISLTPGRAEDAIPLSPGDVVTVAKGSGEVKHGRIDPGEIALWREGKLSVSDETLGDVVALIERQHPAWIRLPEDLASLRVTGLYDLQNPDQALAAVVSPFGLHVQTISPYLRIISRK